LLQVNYLGLFRRLDMSTVIVRSFMPEGFVVGSDGLMRSSPDGAIASHDEQKIFCFDGNIAFSFCGSVRLDGPNSSPFDFVRNCEVIANTLPPDRFESLRDYADQIGQALRSTLRDRRQRNEIRFTAEKNERQSDGRFIIARVMMDGFFKEIPSRATLTFLHRNQATDFILESPPPNTQTMVAGPDSITKTYCLDPVFAKYRDQEHVARNGVDSISRSIHEAKGIIEAMGSQEAKAMEPLCYGIGGRTQIATILPGEGFKWVKGFEPLSY